MKTYQIKIASWRDPTCTRTVELPADRTLRDVHDVIQREFDLDNDHRWAFFLSGEWWDRDTEFKGDQVGRGSASAAVLGSLDLEVGMKVAYVFDFGDELWHDLEVIAAGERRDGITYPQVLAREGKPPPQYPVHDEHGEDEQDENRGDKTDAGAEERDASAAGGAPSEPAKRVETAPEISPAELVPPPLVVRLRAVLDFRDERGFDDESTLDGRQLSEALAVAEAVLDICTTAQLLHEVSHAVDHHVEVWIQEVIDDAAAGNAIDGAARIAERFAAITGFSGHWKKVALGFARAGRREEALAALAKVKASDQPDVIRLSLARAEVFALLKDHGPAEKALRELLARRWLSGTVRRTAVRVLHDVLEATGRTVDAKTLLHEEAVRQRGRQDAASETVRRDAPKIGRNDACPCGSGKKYKKCCG